MTRSPSRARRSMGRLLLAGTLVTTLLALGVGAWAATTEISGAVVTPGNVVVDSSVKRVQHPTGGIISELRVSDGQHVSRGEIVVQLDATVTQASLAMVSNAISELLARRSRLLAEQASATAITFHDSLDADDPKFAEMMAGETRLMESRRAAREGQKAQLREQIVQSEQEILGNEAQVAAVRKRLLSFGDEVEKVTSLHKDKLVTDGRLSDLDRSISELEGTEGQLIATIAMIRGRISQTKLQIVQLDEELHTEVTKELRELDAQLGELTERQVTAIDQLERVAIRAPQDGYIHQLAVHTVGGVVAPGETLMLVVPDNDDLIVETRVSPQDVDQISVGQEAIVRLSSFTQRTTPDLEGVVLRVSADHISDGQSGQAYYLTRIRLGEGELDKLGSLELVPGMPAEVFIKTQDRTVLAYFVQPMTDQIARAFREE